MVHGNERCGCLRRNWVFWHVACLLLGNNGLLGCTASIYLHIQTFAYMLTYAYILGALSQLGSIFCLSFRYITV